MIRHIPISRQVLSGVIVAVGCLALISSSTAQTSKDRGYPVVVGRKEASRLAWDQVAPEYPALARVNYIQGHVRVELLVSRDGRVVHAHVVRGHPFLAASALKAIRKWLYHPLVTKTGPAPFVTTVEMNFALRARTNQLLPPRAERDLDRQVKPPAVLTHPIDASSTSLVRLRLLLNDKGQVIDSQPLDGVAEDFGAAERIVQHWTFDPAHWGSLPVPWYLDVEVPVANPTVHQAAGDPGSR